MTKQEAIELLTTWRTTSRVGDLAYLLNISSSAVSQWPNELRKYHIQKLYFAAKDHGFPQRTINKLEKLLKTMRS